MSRPYPALAAAALLGLFLTAPVSADSLGASVRLLDGGLRDDGTYLAGLEIDLEPGWKTYWRMPGKGGLPPGFDWSGSENVASVNVLWPAPTRLADAYGDSIGYTQRVVLPLEIEPAEPDQLVRLSVIGLVGVCEKVCVPLDVDLTAALDPEASAGRIERHLDRVPRMATAAEAAAIEGRRSADGTLLDLVLPSTIDDVFASGDGVANGLSEGAGGHRSVALSGRNMVARPIVLTVIAGTDAYEMRLD